MQRHEKRSASRHGGYATPHGKKRQANAERYMAMTKKRFGAAHKVEHTAQTRRGSAGLLEIPPAPQPSSNTHIDGPKTQPQ